MRRYLDHERYQHQRWPVKLWRRRYQLLIPYEAVVTYRSDPEFFDHSFWNALNVARGMADARMGWIYTVDEVWPERVRAHDE